MWSEWDIIPSEAANDSACFDTAGGPVRIAYRTHEGSAFRINAGPLLDILTRPDIADLPIAVFSMNGPIRCGKSFLLNQIIKYLKFHKSHPDTWINQELPHKFEWKFQFSSVTQGIQVWPEPFILHDEKLPDKKIALILIDNQGLEDATTDVTSTHKLFCLSNLLSSVFTYGDTKYRSKNFLENLHQHVEFSQTIERDSRGTDGGESSTTPFKFGTLILQCKDFRFLSDFPCNGCEFYDKTSKNLLPPGKCLFTRYFRDSDLVTKNVNLVKSAIQDMYSEIQVCTMRGPGNQEPNDTTFTTSDTWDPNYLLGIQKFIRHTISYEFLSCRTKRIYGNLLTAEEFAPFVKHWTTSLMNSDYKIRVLSSLETSRNVYYGDKINKSMTYYKQLLDAYLAKPNGVSFGKFQKEALEKVEKELWTSCLYSEWKNVFVDVLNEKVGKQLDIHAPRLKSIEETKKFWDKTKSILAGTGGIATTAAGIVPLVVGEAMPMLVAGGVIGTVGVATVIGSAGWYAHQRKKLNQSEKTLKEMTEFGADTDKLLEEGICFETILD